MNKGKKWTNRYSYQFEGIQNPYVVGDYIVTSGTDKSYCIVLDRNFNLVGYSLVECKSNSSISIVKEDRFVCLEQSTYIDSEATNVDNPVKCATL